MPLLVKNEEDSLSKISLLQCEHFMAIKVLPTKIKTGQLQERELYGNEIQSNVRYICFHPKGYLLLSVNEPLHRKCNNVCEVMLSGEL